jgi:mycothiol system anti-sigma-R factor
MRCDDVKRVVYFFLDGVLADAKQHDVRSHLDVCPECGRRAAVSQRLRVFVRRRLSRVEAPAHLKRRLQRSIRAFAAEWSS